jgi:nucleoid DNA-binding protein
MAGKTLKRADLGKAIYRQCTLSHAQAMKLVESVLKEIKDCLERGETVRLSSFGSFLVRKIETKNGTQSDDRCASSSFRSPGAGVQAVRYP